MIHIGERLQKERIKKGLTLEEVAKATKIRSSFLDSLEKGEYKKLPSSTYAYGFVRNYAKFLGLPQEETLALFKREYDEEKFYKVLPEGLVGGKDFPLHRTKVGRGIIVVVCIFLVFILYILFQYRYAILNPPLNISNPAENSVISSQTIDVIGKTDSNATVFVNEEAASLDKEGNFRKKINVFSGKTKITIKSVNKFGRITIVERNLEIKPSLE